MPESQWQADLLAADNLLVLHSMTKYWGLAGLRLGHAVAAPALAAALRAAAPPWSVNACAQAAGMAALGDLEHHRRSVDLLTGERDRVLAGLHAAGWVTEPTTDGDALIALRSGKVRFVLTDKVVGRTALRDGERIEPSGAALFHAKLAFALREGQKDWWTLLNYTVWRMHRSGALREMSMKWYHYDS